MVLNLEEVINKFEGKPLTLPANQAQYIQIVPQSSPDNALPEHLQLNLPQPFGTSPVQPAKIIDHRILAQGKDIKTVYELTLQSSNLKYIPGDTIGILTKNRPNEVERIIKNLGYSENADEVIKVEVNNPKKKLPIYVSEHGTIRKFLMECFDIRSVPKKLFLRAMIDHVSSPKEKRFLEVLCSKEGSEEYSTFISSGNGTFLALIDSFESFKLPFEILLQHLPRLLPRPYSLCSSMETHGDILKIIFSIHDEKEGLATTMLKENSTNNGFLYIYTRQSTNFKYSHENLGKSLILIGAGTGIAPYLSFLRFKDHMKAKGNVFLLIGSRYKSNNLFNSFKDEIGSNIQIFEAYSREQDSLKYVQDLIQNNQEFLSNFIKSENPIIYVCGEGKTMLPEIEKKIAGCLVDCLGTEEEAFEAIKQRKKDNLYLEDVWL